MIKETKKSLFDSVFRKSTIAIAVMSLVIAISFQVKNGLETDKDLFYLLKERQVLQYNTNDSLLIKLQREQQKLNTLIQGFETDSLSNNFALNERLTNMSIRLKLLEEQNLALRQAINPINPEEILTIARLNDGLKVLSESHLNTNKSANEKFNNFKTSVFRELDASSKSINWLFVVLIPIVMNLLYTIWKDSKEKKNKENIT